MSINSVGYNNTPLAQAILNLTNQMQTLSTQLATGDERVLIDPSWNSNGRVFVRQAWPLPATIVAVVPRLEVGE